MSQLLLYKQYLADLKATLWSREQQDEDAIWVESLPAFLSLCNTGR